METRMPRRLALLLWILALAVSVSVSVSAKKHLVGGKKGWAPDVNYTEWASHESFCVGDWIVFSYQRGMTDVVQVNATDFDRCSAKNPIRKWNQLNRYRFYLEATGHFYFISSYHSYCRSRGMKLHILVVDIATPPPPNPFLYPRPPSGSSPVTPAVTPGSSPITRSPSSFPVFSFIAVSLAIIYVLFIIGAAYRAGII